MRWDSEGMTDDDHNIMIEHKKLLTINVFFEGKS